MLSRPTSSRWAMPWADSRPGEGSEPIERSSVRKTPNTTTQPTSRMTTPAASGFRLMAAITPVGSGPPEPGIVCA